MVHNSEWSVRYSQEELLDVSFHKSHKEGQAYARWDQVQEGRLCVLEEVHDTDRHQQTEEVCDKPSIEVRVRLLATAEKDHGPNKK